MISIGNVPTHVKAADSDFTIESYRALVRQALSSYRQATYRDIPWGQRFILWRHDCDYSLNRSWHLGRLEAEAGLRSTYFINPHSDFYNLLEVSQLEHVRSLIRLGHDVGLHFDAAFHATSSEEQLHEQVTREADLLEDFVGVRPAAFSFHNPTEYHLTCEAETYGGLLNCYSRRFKAEVPYCSDSNGYWRFRRLADVLAQATDPCLQVLTHPGWWHEKPMPARRRIFVSAYGRARATMRRYDSDLERFGRANLVGASQSIEFMRLINPRFFELADYLWNTEQFELLFIELWRLLDTLVEAVCQHILLQDWGVRTREVESFLAGVSRENRVRLLQEICGDSQASGSDYDDAAHQGWLIIRNKVCSRPGSVEPALAEKGAVYLCGLVRAISAWRTGKYAHCVASFPFVVNQAPDSEVVQDTTPSGGADKEPRRENNRWEALKKHVSGGEGGRTGNGES